MPAGPEKVTAKEAARHETNQESRTVRQIGSVADVHRLPALPALLCGFFWLAGESPVLAAGVDGDALSARAVLSGDASLSAPERDEKLAVQAAAQATSPVVRTLAVGMDAADYTETVTCDYTPVYIDDSFGGYCYVIDGAAWLSADAFAEMLGLESATVTDGDTQTVTVDGRDIAATYGAVSYTGQRPLLLRARTGCTPWTARWCCRWRIWRRSSASRPHSARTIPACASMRRAAAARERRELLRHA